MAPGGSKPAGPGSAGAFVFVNTTSDSSAAGHKASRSARAFVMRNARAARPWTTRSKASQAEDAALTADTQDEEDHAAEDQKVLVAGDEPANRRRPSATGKARQGSVGKPQPKKHRQQQQSPKSRRQSSLEICPRCNHELGDEGSSDGQLECAVCNKSLAVLSAQTGLSGEVDPFRISSVRLDGPTSYMLDFFIKAVSPQIVPMAGPALSHSATIQAHWIVPSLQQSAFMHAMLGLIALQLSILQPQQTKFRGLVQYHKMQAIKKVQQGLNDPGQAVSDENLAAVFNLMCIEENLFLPEVPQTAELHADQRQRVAHMNGLKEMIRLRGGVHGLASSKMLQHLIVRHTVPQLGICWHKSYLLPRDLIGQMYHGYPVSSPSYEKPAPMTNLFTTLGFDESLIHLVKIMECLEHDRKAWAKAPERHEWDALDVQTIYSMMISHLIRWYIEGDDKNKLRPAQGLVCLCFIQSIAFLGGGKAPMASGPVTVLSRMKRMFDAVDDPLEGLHGTGVDLWIGILAVLSSDGHANYEDQFWQIYLNAVRNQGDRTMETFEDVKAAMHICMWNTMMDLPARIVWDETPPHWKREGASPDSHNLADPTNQRIRLPRSLRLGVLLSASNPYMNGHPAAHINVEGDESAYNL
ncbi:uncharacterized protein B0I36DRAFT_359872 [Microdochium trichocladiopsis]|uniref:Uncharacterized protein n=1 Tax=Microdochium trichocladiopsis TaxID=1682393 RepID=A0A9P8YHY8_9PEZI|nr:uncharacterized protein B0I36DRAFT_359872 [Microdochium trichocladiopsis]KAH7038288.1 hypothetical protein B0I36DRAFT_359872 [Microdochium trichocladiopsis]